jgi:membrane protein DedA with SNARE-associated domain
MMVYGTLLIVVGLVVADFFLPVLPSATIVAVAAGYALGEPLVIVALVMCAAGASWLGDVLGYRVARLSRSRRNPDAPPTRTVPKLEARLRRTLMRYPYRTALLARFMPAGRTALAWVAAVEPRFRHGYMSAMVAGVWACYTVGLGLFIGWLLGPGLFSTATTATTIAAVGLAVGWYARSQGAADAAPTATPAAAVAPEVTTVPTTAHFPAAMPTPAAPPVRPAN